MPRLRTIQEAYAFLKEQDPGTSITQHFLRCAAVRGTIPTIKAGKKYLIDIDALQENLSGKVVLQDEAPQIGGIRSIAEHGRD